MSRKFAALAAGGVAALVGGAVVLTTVMAPADQFADCRIGQVAGGQIGGPFTLVNGEGQTVTDQDVLTDPSLIYFGYTYCPDVCPLDTFRNAEATYILEEQGKEITPIFISVDSERDSPEVVSEFAANMHERMIGLTGSPEQVRAASQAYKTYYSRQDSDDEFYLIDHSTLSYLVLPEHGFVEFFRRDLTPDQLADSVACFLDAA
ncbi:SCO family protein [Cognatishimia sp. MH4019]|uniref:SCO family protein n=1 Tax=Cognatishimia sp. MH4019 TaxID=2854030 RepID=UPI001CD5A1ED|nr:SCO family protein [Cognatishimia sp. MH4019]